MVYDFARSYLQFRSERVNHTPRLELDAACRLDLPGGAREFFLTVPCIGERMYLETGLIHAPAFEFLMIAEHGGECAIVRRQFDSPVAPYECSRAGDAMATQSGVPARIAELAIFPAPAAAAQPVTSYGAFRDALLGNSPLVGVTRYQAGDGTAVTLTYPAKTTNVAHAQEAWQVDAGPLLAPDPAAPLGQLAAAGLLCGAFHLAFMVFNRFDYAELAVRTAPPLSTDPTGPYCTVRPGDLRPLSVQTRLYALPSVQP